ncbi:MAG: GNAT family N-acetyltransferase [Patescibacteria group bacterium]
MENKTSSSLSIEQKGEEPPSLRNNLLFSKSLPIGTMDSFLVCSDIEIVRDITQAKEIWHQFMPAQTFFDTWEFRFAFYEAYKHEPYFMVLKKDQEILALLPLWYEQEEKKYFWFGSDWQEEVRFFTKKPEHIACLLKNAPSPLFLNGIEEKSANSIKDFINFEPDSSKYILNVESFKNHEDYLVTLKKNTRRNLRKDRNHIIKLNPQITLNNFKDIEELIRLSKDRMTQKNQEADWLDPRRQETFRNVIKFAGKSYNIKMITIKINNKVAGVDLVVLFGTTYITVKCGYNVKEFSGIGNYMNLFEIDDAINLKMKKIDFLQNNYTWKSGLFESVKLFKYEKP